MIFSTAELTIKRGMPVTIITGFLGSGKTTLLNHIISNNKDLKVAVLVNEFGDINIDSQLLVSMDEDLVEQGTGGREQGTGNRGKGTGEQGTGGREQGNREQGTGNRGKGTGNREQGTGGDKV